MHFHFKYRPQTRRGGVRSQFHCEFARQTTRKEYVAFSLKWTGPESAEEEAQTWDYELSEDARKPRTKNSMGKSHARIRLIFTATPEMGGATAVRWITQRLGNATASALDKANARLDWKAPTMAFLNSAKTPVSIEGRLLDVLDHYGVAKDPAWVAQAVERYAKADSQMKLIAQSLKGYLGTPHGVELIYYCMEFDWNR
ncbi:hypothetical protein RQP46_003210 [Phenoliferia psychrophenolica]